MDVAHPDPAAVNILDIAQALSMTCRYGGHCRDFYSVAEHSLLVHLIGVTGNPKNNLALLLHDAAEAYVGDLVTPLKRVLRAKNLEDDWLRAIEQKLDLGTLLSEPSSLVKARRPPRPVRRGRDPLRPTRPRLVVPLRSAYCVRPQLLPSAMPATRRS